MVVILCQKYGLPHEQGVTERQDDNHFLRPSTLYSHQNLKKLRTC